MEERCPKCNINLGCNSVRIKDKPTLVWNYLFGRCSKKTASELGDCDLCGAPKKAILADKV